MLGGGDFSSPSGEAAPLCVMKAIVTVKPLWQVNLSDLSLLHMGIVSVHLLVLLLV